jgi:hypothetical protein
MDVEADAIIRALFKRNPDAAYRVTMMAISLSAAPAAEQKVERPRHKGWLAALFDKREATRTRREPAVS